MIRAVVVQIQHLRLCLLRVNFVAPDIPRIPGHALGMRRRRAGVLLSVCEHCPRIREHVAATAICSRLWYIHSDYL